MSQVIKLLLRKSFFHIMNSHLEHVWPNKESDPPKVSVHSQIKLQHGHVGDVLPGNFSSKGRHPLKHAQLYLVSFLVVLCFEEVWKLDPLEFSQLKLMDSYFIWVKFWLPFTLTWLEQVSMATDVHLLSSFFQVVEVFWQLT